jgi:hypothetical protein
MPIEDHMHVDGDYHFQIVTVVMPSLGCADHAADRPGGMDITRCGRAMLETVDDLEGPYPSGDLEAIKQDRRANAGRKQVGRRPSVSRAWSPSVARTGWQLSRI